MAKLTEQWKEAPEEHDFPAAADYLELVAGPAQVKRVVAALRSAPNVMKKAKDLCRASNLPVLPMDNVHVTDALKKVKKGGRLSPVLLVRGNAASGAPMTIADGYHRVCASWHIDDDADIPCRIVDFEDEPVVAARAGK
jgi:hypothetical protein